MADNAWIDRLQEETREVEMFQLRLEQRWNALQKTLKRDNNGDYCGLAATLARSEQDSLEEQDTIMEDTKGRLSRYRGILEGRLTAARAKNNP